MKNNLKEIRTNVGLTQEQLAGMVGTTKQYISMLESGNRDISKVRMEIVEKICGILGCRLDDILTTVEFEFDDEGKLIIDNLYLDNRFPNNYIVEICNNYFIAPNNIIYKNRTEGKNVSDMLEPMYGRHEKYAMEMGDYMYVFLGCVPRKGFNVKLGRAITENEFLELKERFNLNESNTTSEFETSKGSFYGNSATKYYTAIQIRVDSDKAIPLEYELRNKGIEADNCNVGLVNIRVK